MTELVPVEGNPFEEYDTGKPATVVAPPQAEARAFQPSWRDRFSQWLMGEQRVSPAKRNFVQGLTGSSGLGPTGMSLADFTAPGAVLSAQESLQGGHPGQAAADVMLGSIMPGGKAMMKPLAAAGAGLAGMLTPSTLGEAEAAPKLTRDQQRQLEIEKQQSEQAQKAEENRARLANEAAEKKAKIDAETAERMKKFDAEQASKQREETARFEKEQKAEAEAAEKAKAKEKAYEPFNKKYPVLAEALPAVGALSAAAFPGLSKLESMVARNTSVREFLAAVARGEGALKGADPAAKAASKTELEGLVKAGNPPPAKASPLSIGLGAALPAEAVLAPTEWNAMMLPSDSPDRAQALDLLTSPKDLASRLVPSMVGGAGMAGLGAKLPVGNAPVPIDRARGLAGALKPVPKARVKKPVREDEVTKQLRLIQQATGQ